MCCHLIDLVCAHIRGDILFPVVCFSITAVGTLVSFNGHNIHGKYITGREDTATILAKKWSPFSPGFNSRCGPCKDLWFQHLRTSNWIRTRQSRSRGEKHGTFDKDLFHIKQSSLWVLIDFYVVFYKDNNRENAATVLTSEPCDYVNGLIWKCWVDWSGAIKKYFSLRTIYEQSYITHALAHSIIIAYSIKWSRK